MFSLIIAIVSIALVVALVALSGYFGGSTITDARAQAEAARLKNEESQLLGAAEMFNAQVGRWPQDVAELVTFNFLSSVPRGLALSPAASGPEFIATAVAAEPEAAGVTTWQMATAGQPVFVLPGHVPVEVCRQFNRLSRGDDGVLTRAYSGLTSQCYGEAGVYQIVSTKTGVDLAAALNGQAVMSGPLPAAGDQGWDVGPGQAAGAAPGAPGASTPGPAQPEPVGRLSMSSALEDFGTVRRGESVTSASRALSNLGDGPAQGVAITVSGGFTLESSTCGPTLAAGASCSFSVGFNPLQTGAATGNVSVTSVNAGTASFGIAGSASESKATLSSAPAVNLSVDPVAATTATTIVSYVNAGTEAMTLRPTALSAPLRLTGNTCQDVAPGQSCQLTVRLEAGGAFTAGGGSQLLNIDGVENKPEAVAINWVIYTTIPQWSSATLDFGKVAVGATVSKSIQLTNKGTGVAHWSGALQGLSGEFTANTSACAAVDPNSSCAVTITFSPKAFGDYSAANVVPAPYSAAGNTLRLTGAAAVPAFILSPPNEAYKYSSGGGIPGSLFWTYGANVNATYGQVVSLPVIVRNTGLGALTMAKYEVYADSPGSLVITANTCPAVLPEGSSCTVTVDLDTKKLKYNKGKTYDMVFLSVAPTEANSSSAFFHLNISGAP